MFKLNVFGWFTWDTIPTLGVQNIMFAYIIKLKLQNSNFLKCAVWSIPLRAIYFDKRLVKGYGTSSR